MNIRMYVDDKFRAEKYHDALNGIIIEKLLLRYTVTKLNGGEKINGI